MKTIRVIGLSDGERHGLNSVVRLSVGRKPSYTIWQQGAGRPDILLLDGSHPDALRVAQSNRAQSEHVLWVGDAPPEFVHYSLPKPIAWVHLLAKMDAIIQHNAPTVPPSDFVSTLDLVSTLEGEQTETQPQVSKALSSHGAPKKLAPMPGTRPVAQMQAGAASDPIALSDFNASGSGESGRTAPILYLQADDSLGRAPDQRKRVLIVDANTQFRLYLKAVLSVGNQLWVDETGHLDTALAMVQDQAYDSVLIDMAYADGGAWKLCRSVLASALALRPGDTRISRPNVYFLSQNAGLFKRLQAKRAGASGVLIRPRKQEHLDILFAAVNRYAQA